MEYSYDDANRGLPSRLESDKPTDTTALVSAVSWNEFGAPLAQTWGSGTNAVSRVWSYETDTMRLDKLEATVGAGPNKSQNLAFNYWDDGNVKDLTDFRNASQKQCFEYDDLSRLTVAYTKAGTCSGVADWDNSLGTGPYRRQYQYLANPTTGSDTVTQYVAGIFETTTEGATTTSRSYYSFNGQTIGYRHRVTGSGERRFLLTDHLGTNAVEVNEATGAVTEQYYLPFGDLRGSSSNGLGTDRTYTGQTADESTGLMFYNARYYLPALRRFISADTIVPNPGNPQDLNRYTYVRNGPVHLTDPSGHCVTADDESCLYGSSESDGVVEPTENDDGSSGSEGSGDPVDWSDGSGGGSWWGDPWGDNLEVIYTYSWRLFEGGRDDARLVADAIRTDPNAFFPFTVDLAECDPGYCTAPISLGNVLDLSAALFDPGPVRVVEVGDTSWTFLALPGHVAEGGTVAFRIVASEPEDGRSWVSLEVTAKGAGKGLEGAAPSAIQRFAGKDEWSMMVVNIHCNRTMFGQEPIAFC